MRDPLSKVSVRWKLALMFIGVCLLTFGLGGLLVSGSARSALEREIHARLDYQCAAWSDGLDDHLRLLGRRTEDFASDGFIRSRMEALAAGGTAPELAERLEAELKDHLARNKLPLEPAFADLFLLDADGGRITAVKDLDWGSLAIVSREAANLNLPWFSDLLVEEAAGGQPAVAIAAPVRDLRGERVVGRIVSRVEPGVWIASALRRTGQTGAGNESASLTLEDRAGRALPVPSVYLSGGGLDPDSELAAGGFGLQVAGAGSQPTREGGRWITQSLPVGVNGWTARVGVPTDAVLAPVAGFQSKLLGYGAVLAVLAGLLLFFPMRFLVRPLLELRAAARRIQGGAYEARVSVDSEDEIGDLARSFNHMAEAVEERTRGLEAAARDLERHQAEIRAERDRLDGVIRSMRDGLMVLDGDGRLVLANEGAKPLLALLEERAAVTSHHRCHEHEAGVTACRECLFDPASPARSCVVDVGSSVYEIHSAALPADRNGRRGKVLVARDISDRVAQDEREIHQERLAVLGEVAAVMAHELNNPLAAINMFNQMLLSDLPEASPLRENCEVISRNTETCKRTIRELLDYATGASPEVDRVDVHATLEDVARFLRPVSERSRVGWEWDLRADRPEVMGDEIQVRQVFVNLIMNAIQAMEGAGGTVRLLSRDGDGELVVEIIDTGPGIPAAQQQQVFRPFYTTKDRGIGTGLGLPTSRRIAEMHGGSVELVESRPGRTVFRVRLRHRGVPAPELGLPV